MKVSVGISNRHLHLTREVYELLFDESISKRNDLMQEGEFASNQVVRISTDKGYIDNVRLIGPLREYNQVEILRSDAYKLGINPPIRKSGDLKDSENITISTSKSSVYLKSSCICQQFHVHMNPETALQYGVKEDDIVDVVVNTGKDAIIKAHVKITPHGVLEFQIDRDDANSLNLHNGDEVEINL